MNFNKKNFLFLFTWKLVFWRPIARNKWDHRCLKKRAIEWCLARDHRQCARDNMARTRHSTRPTCVPEAPWSTRSCANSRCESSCHSCPTPSACSHSWDRCRWSLCRGLGRSPTSGRRLSSTLLSDYHQLPKNWQQKSIKTNWKTLSLIPV